MKGCIRKTHECGCVYTRIIDIISWDRCEKHEAEYFEMLVNMKDNYNPK